MPCAAMALLQYRDQLFPCDAYRRTFDALLDALDERDACRRMLALAHIAAARPRWPHGLPTCQGR